MKSSKGTTDMCSGMADVSNPESKRTKIVYSKEIKSTK
jgi:hypothetical protein